jgi:hypothetical protein
MRGLELPVVARVSRAILSFGEGSAVVVGRYDNEHDSETCRRVATKTGSQQELCRDLPGIEMNCPKSRIKCDLISKGRATREKMMKGIEVSSVC